MGRDAQEIFEQAVTVPKEDRRAFLDGACGRDADCRAEVESLLVAHDEAAAFLDAPTSGAAAAIAQPLSEGPGSIIGRYKLLELIGEGGFGAVYMADQKEPVHRRVALKIIKLGMDTKQVIARFEAERQALAMMDHPNIAKVLDAGATETGRPYFVMELVKGVPITEYCDGENLTTHERLDLFIDVCNAVQHAHQKGIIHRDLKPTNVLVTMHDDRPVPKVIDFGIAKATNRELTDKTLFTEFRQFVGTPEFMSPEQATMSGLDIDTRTDIYSLGVLLYQLLTGTTPFDGRTLREKGYAELQRIIHEEEPPRPSTRLSTLGDDLASIAKRRGDDPSHLAKSLQGDLDWIVMKALEKNRTRRYETARDFALDVRRHLDDEPVIAGPPGAAYRLSKFLRRNRVAVSAGAVVAAALVIGFSLTVYGLVQSRKGFAEAVRQQSAAESAREEAERERLRTEQALQAEASQRELAQTEAQRARAVTDFLTGLLAQTDPEVALSPDVTVRSILDGASEEVDRSFGDQPEAEATVRTTIGQAYASLGEPELAEPHLRRALAIREQLPGTSAAELYATLYPLTGVLFVTGHPDLVSFGPRMNEVGLAVIAETRPELSATLDQLFKANISGQRERSDRLFARALEQVADAPPGDPVWILVADSLFLNGHTLWHFFNDDAAEPYFEQGLGIYRRELPAGHPQVAYALGTLVGLLNGTDRHEEAESLVREAREILRGALPAEHMHVAMTDSLLGVCLVGQGRLAEAETLLLSSHERITAAQGRTPTLYVYDSFARLVSLYDAWGRPDEASAHRAALAEAMLSLRLLPRWPVVDAAFGPEHRALASMLDELDTLTARSRAPGGGNLNAQRDRILAALLPAWRSSLPRDHTLSACIARQLNFWAASWDGWTSEEGRLVLEEVLAVLRRWDLPADRGTTLVFLAAHANATGDHRRGEDMAREAWSLMRRAYGDDTWFAALAAREVGRSLVGQALYEEAEPFLVDAYEIFAARSGEDVVTRAARRNLLELYRAWGRPDRARPYVRADLAHARRVAEAPEASADAKNRCAWTLLTCQPTDLRDPEAALRLAREASAMTNHASPPVLDTLALAQHLTGDTAAAVETERKALSLLPADSPGRGEYEAALARFETALGNGSE
jgi:tetratricopeptide (TPR) repeat protein